MENPPFSLPILSLLHDRTPTPVLICDLQSGEIGYLNRAAAEQLPILTQRTTVEPLFETASDWRELQLRIRTQGQIRHFETRLNGPHHRTLWMQLAASSWQENGQTWLMLSAHDVSERRKREFQLQASEELHRQILERTSEGYVQFDASSNRIADVNPSFCQLLGRHHSEIIGATLADFLAEDSPPSLLTARDWPYRSATVQGELVMLHKDGHRITVQANANVLHDEVGQPVTAFALLTDISSRKENEERMLYLAFYDTLTALPNRLLLQERLHQALLQHRRHGTPCALMFLDLDNFKQVNDTLGHDVGDRLLQEVARRLNRTIRESDTVARLGGDEFVILLYGIEHTSKAAQLAEKIITLLSTPAQIGHHSLPLSVSIGIALTPEDGSDSITLKKHADMAMYKAKAAGKNTYRFYERDETEFDADE